MIIYISGNFNYDIDFDGSPTSSNIVSAHHGGRDVFFAKYNENLDYDWVFNPGAPTCNGNTAHSIEIDDNNKLQQLQGVVNLYRALGGGWK